MKDHAFKYELKAADQAISRGAFSDGLVFAKSAFKMADTVPEFDVILEVIQGAVEDMSAVPLNSSGSEKDSASIAARESIASSENKTAAAYKKLKKEVELASVGARRKAEELGRAAKVALLRGNSSQVLTWQPSYIASKRESLSNRDSEASAADDDGEEDEDDTPGSAPPKGCCIIA